MACARDPNDPGGEDAFETPKTPRMVLRDDEAGEELTPDTEQNVAEETDSVFRNFVYHMINNHRSDQDADDTPSLPELTAFNDPPFAPAAQVGRQLALIGDDINNRYEPQFNHMIYMLNLTPDTAYEAFAGVARKFFRDGVINWGRVITLLCFGYRMAVSVIQSGIRGFFAKIVGYVCKFIMAEKIAKWIADQGGWRAALRYIPESVGWPTIGAICGLASVAVIAAFFISRKH